MWALKRVGLACELHNRPKACPPAGPNLHSVVEEARKVLHCSEEQGGGGIKAEVTGTHHPSRCSPFLVSPALQPQWVPSIPQALQGDCLGAHLLPPPGPSRLHPPHLTQAETQRQTSTIRSDGDINRRGKGEVRGESSNCTSLKQQGRQDEAKS